MKFNFLAKRCLFCNQKRKLTKEHIYPVWLSEIIKVDDITFEPSTWNYLTKTTEQGTTLEAAALHSEERKIKYSDFVVKLVCEECNSGWMSQLESDVKSIFFSLHRKAINIENDYLAAYNLSLWAIIKLIMITQTFKEKYEFSRFLLDLLYNRIIPEGFIVEFANMNSHFINYTLGATLSPHAKRISHEDMEHVFDGFFIGALHLGTVGIRVSYLKTAHSVNRIQINERLLVLFPFQSKLPLVILPPGIGETDTDKAGEVRALCDSLTIGDTINP